MDILNNYESVSSISREELIELANKIGKVQGTEDEIDGMLELLKKNVPDPLVSDYICGGSGDGVGLLSVRDVDAGEDLHSLNGGEL